MAIDSFGREIDLTLDPKQLSEYIYTNGLGSKSDYDQIIHQYNNHQDFYVLNIILRRMINNHTLYKGTGFNRIDQPSLPANLLIKIVRNWSDFINQLSDYNYRPQLRVTSKRYATHKFDLKTGNIIEFKRSAKKKSYTKTKKQSVTWISDDLDTKLIEQGIGVLLDESKCDCRAFFKQNAGTYLRDWVGSQDAVNSYKRIYQQDHIVSKDEFRTYVNSARNLHHNEVLAGFPREAVIGIVVYGGSLSEAIKQQQKLKAIGVDCPIYNYNPFVSNKNLRLTIMALDNKNNYHELLSGTLLPCELGKDGNYVSFPDHNLTMSHQQFLHRAINIPAYNEIIQQIISRSFNWSDEDQSTYTPPNAFVFVALKRPDLIDNLYKQYLPRHKEFLANLIGPIKELNKQYISLKNRKHTKTIIELEKILTKLYQEQYKLKDHEDDDFPDDNLHDQEYIKEFKTNCIKILEDARKKMKNHREPLRAMAKIIAAIIIIPIYGYNNRLFKTKSEILIENLKSEITPPTLDSTPSGP